MKNSLYCILTFFVAAVFVGCKNDGGTADFTLTPLDAQPVVKTNSAKIYVHYMPWFETPETNNGKWGWHWTMANKNPDNLVNGRRDIAAWYCPLIEPYASSDEAVLEYHLLLMKYAGIDGVLVDWYGLTDKNDLPQIKNNTDALFKATEKTGLEFAVVYEDRYLEGSKTAMIAQAKTDMNYLRDNFFGKPYYARRNGKPLLLVFGPNQLQDKADWESVLSVFAEAPSFYTLQNHYHTASTTAAGEYLWVMAQTAEQSYARIDETPDFLGGAYPGFRDYYQEGGGGTRLFTVEHDNGATLRTTLNLSKTKQRDFIQLITWNDFGEGTMIEPTQEFGYTFLTVIQQFVGVEYSDVELKSIKRLFDLRKEYAGKREKNKRLDQAFYYFVSLQPDEAKKMMDEL
jgi:hypothetical protein